MNEQQWKVYLETEDRKIRLLENIQNILELLQMAQNTPEQALFVCEVEHDT